VLSLVFIAAGVLLAFGVSFLFRYAIVLPDSGNLGLFLNRGHLVLIPTAGGVLSIAGIILLFTALFSYFPARRGGRITPVEALSKVY